MSEGLNRLLAAALAAGSLAACAALVAPSAALACSGGPSAENVYKECLPSAGGEKPTGGNTGSTGSTGSAHISSKSAQVIAHAGKDSRSLAALVHTGPRRLLPASGSGSGAAAPSAIGSAFDLGSGPTLLLIVLAGTALLLLGGSGVRVWRGRQHP
jgi:hypothetical protein